MDMMGQQRQEVGVVLGLLSVNVGGWVGHYPKSA